MIKIKNEMSDCEFNVRGHDAVVVINSLEAGLMNCDLLIVIGNEERHVIKSNNIIFDAYKTFKTCNY